MHKPGDLARYPNLKAIFWLGAGVDHLLKDKDLPRQVPIVRLVDDGLTAGMTEYVLLHVLRYHRRLPELEAQQRERQWNQLAYPLAKDRRIGIMGMGVLGSDAASRLIGLGFDVAGWSRAPKQLAGLTSFHGDDRLTPFLNRTRDPGLPAAADAGDDRHHQCAHPGGAAEGRLRHQCRPRRPCGRCRSDRGARSRPHRPCHARRVHDEPLPVEHPFWRHPRITVTPHVASVTISETASRVIIEGLKAMRAGRRPANLVDLAKGY